MRPIPRASVLDCTSPLALWILCVLCASVVSLRADLTITNVSVLSQPCTVVLPPNFNPATGYTLIPYCHGFGETNTDVLAQDKFLLMTTLASNGCVLVSSYAHGNNWGNNPAGVAIKESNEYAYTNFGCTNILPIGQSMGGYPSLLAFYDRTGVHSNNIGWIGIMPACNLASNYAGNVSFSPSASIDAAYGISGDYAAKTAGHDPALLSQAAPYPLPMMFIASVDDTVIPKAHHTDVLRARTLNFTETNLLYLTTGEHGSEGHFDSDKVAKAVAFLTFCRTNRPGIIPRVARATWTPNVTVGVRGGIHAVGGSRTNAIDVTAAPYNADKTGAVDACEAIEAAALAASTALPTNTHYVHFPNGEYTITNGLTIDLDNVTLRGESTNVIFHSAQTVVGHDLANLNFNISVTNGATRGSTVIGVTDVVDPFSAAFAPGDMFYINHLSYGDEGWNYIKTYGGTPAALNREPRLVFQQILITNVSGNSFRFTPPLVWHFTNATQLHQLNHPSSGGRTRVGIGFENITFTHTNAGQYSDSTVLLKISMCADSWITNCNFINFNNYAIFITEASHLTIAHNNIKNALSGGSNHAGVLGSTTSGSLIENNVVAGVFPCMEFNYGFSGNAIFGNYCTNNGGADILLHGVMSFMNLFEANHASVFSNDGLFGSEGSFWTLLNNRFYGAINNKRFSTFMNIVGNVQGGPGTDWSFTRLESEYTAPYPLNEDGFANIGNNGWKLTSGPVAWNFPGWNLYDGRTNGVFALTNDVVNTNFIKGAFAGYVLSSDNWLIAQDTTDTNKYYGPAIPTNIQTGFIQTTEFVTWSNGMRIFIASSGAFQHRNDSNKLTFIRTGNAVFTNGSSFTTVWDAKGPQAVPSSFLYPDGQPVYWNTNWPMTDITNGTAVMNPAMARFYAEDGGEEIPPPESTTIRFGTVHVGTLISK